MSESVTEYIDKLEVEYELTAKVDGKVIASIEGDTTANDLALEAWRVDDDVLRYAQDELEGMRDYEESVEAEK